MNRWHTTDAGTKRLTYISHLQQEPPYRKPDLILFSKGSEPDTPSRNSEDGKKVNFNVGHWALELVSSVDTTSHPSATSQIQEVAYGVKSTQEQEPAQSPDW